MFECFPGYFKHFRKSFRFFLSGEPKHGIDFPIDMVIAFGLHSLAHDGPCNALTDNHYRVLATCFGESHKGQPKSYSLPCLYTTYALLISNSEGKEVFGELFQELHQAIHYNGDLQSIVGNKYPRKFLRSN